MNHRKAFITAAAILFGIGFGVSSAFAAPLAWSTDTALYLTSPAVTFTIVSGSVADALAVNASDAVVTLSSTTGGSFTLISSVVGITVTPSGGSGSVSQTCLSGAATAVIAQSSGSATYTIAPTAEACVAGHAPGSGGGSYLPTPAISWKAPLASATYAPGQIVGLEWLSANGAFVKYSLYYTADGGGSWNAIASDLTSASASWTVPDLAITQGKFKVEGYDAPGTVLASAVSSVTFSVNGAAAQPPVVGPLITPPPATDSTATGAYNPAAARTNTPDINTDKGLQPSGSVSSCSSGTLIKGTTFSAVYYCGADGKRYVFANEKIYLSWYADFSAVQTVPDEALAQISLGGNVTYRPGAKLVKIQTDPKVYAVSRGGTLRWVTTEALARQLYGDSWNRLVDDIPDSFFVNYKVGQAINQ